MKTSDLHYDLPPELIARHPAARRDESRLLVLRRGAGIAHHVFRELPSLLPEGALLVMNDTRVLPARLELRRETGGRLEALFLNEPEPGAWEVMMTGSGRVRPGEVLALERAGATSGQTLRLIRRTESGTWLVSPEPAGETHAILATYGEPPLPPYIRKARTDAADGDAAEDVERYQTVYARSPGAVAAPTAGLHFTPELLETLAAQGIERAFVTLHVGVGTFAPIRTERLEDHQMHAEWYELPEQTAQAIAAARASGRPVVAIGTTSVRVLETCGQDDWTVRPGSGWTRIFIYPPYQFRVVDHLLTNFHLPESTLLAMVFALAGRDETLAAYREAVERRYRFYSYGDAMLVL